MAKPIVERTKKRTKVVYNKKPKKKNNDKKIIIGSVAGIIVLGTSLGLGLGLGLKNDSTKPIDGYPSLVTEKDSYPIKLIYEAKSELAEDLLNEIYGRDTLTETYIEYDPEWGLEFRNKINGVELLIIFPIIAWSINKENSYKQTRKDNKLTIPYFYHAFEMRKNVIYNKVKELIMGQLRIINRIMKCHTCDFNYTVNTGSWST